jgi:molybdopterin converting factor small subunit
LRPFINLFVNSTHIKDLDGLATQLQAGDVLRIVPSIAGGNR